MGWGWEGGVERWVGLGWGGGGNLGAPARYQRIDKAAYSDSVSP